MQKIISHYVIGQLLFLTSSVEPLRGTKVMSIDIRDVPFIASLQYLNREHFCTGTLITNRHVITATHCLDGEDSNEIKVAFGITDFQTATVRYAVAFWVSYNRWAVSQCLQETMYFHDVTIITIIGKIKQSDVSPIRLSNLNKQQIQGKPTTIVGWDSRNKTLVKAEVNVLRDDDCERSRLLVTNVIRKIYPTQLCTAAQPSVLLQGGDSGGPLLDAFGGLIGVHMSVGPQANVAWGHFSDDFLQQYQLNLHSNIAYYRQFIVNVTGYH